MAPTAKIIIRPRRARQQRQSPEADSEEEAAQEPTSEVNEDNDQNENNDEEGDEDADVEMNEEGGDEDEEAVGNEEGEEGDEEVVSVPVKRPRGRPRGRGRPPTGRPRGRPRGSGRGRGRGRGRPSGTIMLRLPRRGASSDGAGGEADGLEASESQAATPAGDDGDDDGSARDPVGGGRPFRKIHGQVYFIDGDEFVTEEDPVGDTKIDADGNLLGGASTYWSYYCT